MTKNEIIIVEKIFLIVDGNIDINKEVMYESR